LDGTVNTLREQVVGSVRPLLLMLFAASAVLLFIACANVANLLIARMASRQGEVALRMAIGASRGRLIQQLLIEALLLAGIGCVGGLALAYAGVKLLLALRPSLVPRLDELGVDGQVLLFAAGISVLTALVLGLLAAWRGANADIRETLSNSQRTQAGSGSSYRLRGSLVVAQIAMTVVLLVGAGLLARSFVQLMTVDTGFRTSGVVVADVGFAHREGVKGVDADALRQEDEMMARARAIPGVTAVGISDAPPFSNGSSNGAFLVLTGSTINIDMPSLSRAFREDKTHVGFASYRVANAGFFKALNIPLISGRMIDDRDRQGAPHVAVISQSLARKQWPNESPIGKSIEFGNIDGDLTPITIVGVVGDTREENLADQPSAAVYLSDQQRAGNNSERFIVMATNGEAPTIAAARQQFRQVRSDVVIRFQTIEDIIASSVATQRFMLVLVGIFGATALLLATLGVYSVLSYLVSQRGKEISVRVALGATSGDVVRLIVKQGVSLAIVGAVIGAGAALAATRLLKTMLYEISTTDPVAYVGVVLMLCIVAGAASYIPARRASRAEPMDVLRAS
jgi:predicted permease